VTLVLKDMRPLESIRDFLGRRDSADNVERGEGPTDPSRVDAAPRMASGPPTASQSQPRPDSLGASSSTAIDRASRSSGAPKRKNRSRKKRNRRQSFARNDPIEGIDRDRQGNAGPSDGSNLSRGASFYQNANLSDVSIASSSLLDHRDQEGLQQRRHQSHSKLALPHWLGGSGRTGQNQQGRGSSHLASYDGASPRHRDTGDDDDSTDRTPLIGASGSDNRTHGFYGGIDSPLVPQPQGRPSLLRRRSGGSSMSGSQLLPHQSNLNRQSSSTFLTNNNNNDYDVNNPPSMPGTPTLDATRVSIFEDLMTSHDFELSTSPEQRRNTIHGRLPEAGQEDHLAAVDPRENDHRRHSLLDNFTNAMSARDVFFPYDVTLPENGFPEMPERTEEDGRQTRRRPRQRAWPDFKYLEEWSLKERRHQDRATRAKKISEPVLVGGRLRVPHKAAWHRPEEDEHGAYRFTYFNENFDKTIHAHDLWSLPQEGQDFVNLFRPDPVQLTDGSSDEEEEAGETTKAESIRSYDKPQQQPSLIDTMVPEMNGPRVRQISGMAKKSGESTPTRTQTPHPEGSVQNNKEIQYGDRPTWWLDVLSPTEEEIKVLSRVFQIHPLTAEDIMMQEAREKVELFQNYYFVNYRTFEQDPLSEDYLEPVNMYVVVFREGLLSFHFSETPHPANVRRRIRQLKDYLIPDADWISYALIDDITDAFDPLTKNIEQEVDDIDDAILRLHSSHLGGDGSSSMSLNEKATDVATNMDMIGGDMLRRVGESRKKVMGLYRLLGNKADVIKGFAKRCNPEWNVAPRSEVGLYLGDIQDHIVTMTGILSHCEK
jgi:magnesium transporter